MFKMSPKVIRERTFYFFGQIYQASLPFKLSSSVLVSGEPITSVYLEVGGLNTMTDRPESHWSVFVNIQDGGGRYGASTAG